MKSEFGSGVLAEVGAFVFVSLVLALLAATHDSSKPCSSVGTCVFEVLNDYDFHLRCCISLPIAVVIYLACGLVASGLFPREVVARGARPPVSSLVRWDADLNVGLTGIIAGTPMIQLFHCASDKYGEASGMRLYKDPLQFGIAWAVLQIPVYLMIWDLTFYVLHRWVLHHPWLYNLCHSGHHAFRPPTAWSGIAVGPIDVIFEGILPYTLLLFLGIPFHEYTVHAANAALRLHACVLHSNCHREYSELSGWLGWLMISPIGHNMHHQYGVKNACNFAPIFKIWDRLLGTLNEQEPFWWEKDHKAMTERGTVQASGANKGD